MTSMAELIDKLQSVFGVFGADDGVDAQDIEAAVRRLGALPASLRLLYLRTGNNVALHHRANDLAMPSELVSRGGFVSFYFEQQAVCEWAVAVSDLAADDPPVYTLHGSGAAVEADADFASITEFTALQTSWQSANGGLPFIGFRHPPDGAARVWSGVEERLGEVGDEIMSSIHGKVWIVDQALVGSSPNGWFGMAARSREAFTSAMHSMGLSVEDWSATNLRPGSVYVF